MPRSLSLAKSAVCKYWAEPVSVQPHEPYLTPEGERRCRGALRRLVHAEQTQRTIPAAKGLLTCQANVTQGRLGYPQAQESLLGKAEVPEQMGGGGWKTVPHPEFLLAKTSFMRTLHHDQPREGGV